MPKSPAWTDERTRTDPIFDRSSQTNGVFTRNEFSFDQGADAYVCPGGKALRRVTERGDNGVLIYRARDRDCAACALKKQCTKAGGLPLSFSQRP